MKNTSVIIIVSMFLITALFAALPGQVLSEDLPDISRAPTTHTPINIEGDAGFTTANGVTGGSGTGTDPYVISDWTIDGSSADYGISVSNTSKHFIIRNCTVFGADISGGNINIYNHYSSGIFLYNVEDAAVSNNVLYDNGIADIRLVDSNTVSVENNTCISVYAKAHILLQGSSYNAVSGNLLDTGITPTGTNPGNGSVPITQYGVWILYSSSDNILKFNSIYNHSMEGMKISNSGNNRMNIHHNNLKWNEGGMEIAGNGHMVNDNLIWGNLKNGINADMTYGSNFLHNDISYNGWNGIYLNYDSGAQAQGQNFINDNIITYNLRDGMVMRGKNDHVDGNLISNNHLNGISIGKHGNKVTSNEIENNTEYGVEIDYWSSDTENMYDCEVYCNNFISNGGSFQARDAGLNNKWNTTTKGNYWSDHTTPDSDSDGIVDLYYYVNVTNSYADEKPVTTPFNISVWGPRFQPAIIDNIARYYEPDNITITYLQAEDEYIGTGLVWNVETNATFFGLSGNVLTADPGYSDIGSYWLHIKVNDNVGAPRPEYDDMNFTVFVTTNDEGSDNGSDPGEDPGNGTDPGDDTGNETDPGDDPGNGTDPGEDPGNGTDPGNDTDDTDDNGNSTDPGDDPGNGTEEIDDGTGDGSDQENPSGIDTEPWSNETNNSPISAHISLPETRPRAGETFSISAWAVDPDIEFGDQLHFSWKIDGRLFVGETIEVELPQGEHTIVLTVTDSFGEKIEYTTSITIDKEDKGTDLKPLLVAIVVVVILALFIASLMIFRKRVVHEKEEDDMILWNDAPIESSPKELRSDLSNFNMVRGGTLDPSRTSPASFDLDAGKLQEMPVMSKADMKEISRLEQRAFESERTPSKYKKRELRELLRKRKGEMDKETYHAVRSILFEE